MQISVSADMQSAVAAGSPALATLLRESPPLLRKVCSETARRILHSFGHPYKLFNTLSGSPSAAPLIRTLWERVEARP